MKILQIGHYNHIVGGSDAVFFSTCDMLQSAGHQVVRFCMDHPNNEPGEWNGYFPKGADTGTVPIRDTLRYFYNGQARRNLVRLLDDIGPVDVAHLHIYHGKQTPSILPVLQAQGIPVVQTLHEYKLACPVYTMLRNGAPCQDCLTGNKFNAVRHACKDGSRLRSGIMVAEMLTSRLLGDVRLVDRFLCVSEFQKDVMARAGIGRDKLATLHNFVAPAAGGGNSGHDGYLLYFGRIEALKGLATLINAVKRGGHRLTIAGTGNWLPELRAQIRDYPGIKYVGFQSGDDLNQLIARAKAVVVPSEWYENCPMSVLEAKALGRPVIGAAIGGIPELIRDRKDGFLYRAGDVASLMDAIRALENLDHANLSQQALQDAKNRFSQSQHLDQLLAHYRDVMALRRETQMQPA